MDSSPGFPNVVNEVIARHKMMVEDAFKRGIMDNATEARFTGYVDEHVLPLARVEQAWSNVRDLPPDLAKLVQETVIILGNQLFDNATIALKMLDNEARLN
jgi:hypothetical protein